MKTIYFKVIFIAAVLMFFSAQASHAVLGNAAGKTAREIIEYTAKKFGIELSKDAGQQFTEKATRFISTHGDDGARVLMHAGPDIMELAAKHGDDLVRMCASHSDDAILFLMKNADEALPIWRQFGKEGTEIMLKHPGLGEHAIKEFGSNGIVLANRLSSESLNKALVLSSKATTQAEKTALFDAIMQRGDEVIEFLWKHKWKIGAGATLYSLLKDTTIITETSSDGKDVKKTVTNLPQRLVENTWNKGLDTTMDKYPWILLVGIAFIILLLYRLFKLIFELPGKLINIFSRRDKTPPVNKAKGSYNIGR